MLNNLSIFKKYLKSFWGFLNYISALKQTKSFFRVYNQKSETSHNYFSNVKFGSVIANISHKFKEKRLNYLWICFAACNNAGGNICPIDGKCYALKLQRTYAAAQALCADLGGSLISGPVTDPDIVDRCE